MGNLTHTVSGDIASFRSAARVPIESLKCHFKPIQDGEGDPSPDNVRPIRGWDSITAYKAKKNIGHIVAYSAGTLSSPTNAPYIQGSYDNSISQSEPLRSVIFTQTEWHDDFPIHHYQNGYWCIQVDNLQFGQRYDLSFKITNITNNPLNASLSNIRIANLYGSYFSPIILNDNTILFKNFLFAQNNKRPLESDIPIYMCGLTCTLSDFMITPANMNDGIWEPYCGNVIPITFPVLGKNKFNYNNANIINNKRLDDVGNEVSDASGSYCKTLVPVIPNTTYTLSGYTENNTSKRIYYIDKNQNFISRGTAFGGNSYTFITPDNCYYCQIQNREIANAGWETLQLELGDIATEYEPYNSNNTVYGGYVDIAKGEVVATHQKLICDGSVQFNYDQAGEVTARVLMTIAGLGGKSPYIPSSHGQLCQFNYVKSSSDASLWSGYISSAKNLVLRISSSISSRADWSQYLSEHPLEVYYQIEEPIHYPLSKTELTTFLNQNNFWSNTNDITEVSYQIHDSNMIQSSKKGIIAAQPHIESPQAAPLQNFVTDMAAPLKECKVYFEPKQDLNGYSKPWVGGSGKNLYNSATDTPKTFIRANEPVGEIVSTTYNYNSSDYIAVEPNTTYTINYNATTDATSAGMVFFGSKNAEDIIDSIALVYQTKLNNNSTSYTFTTAQNCNYLRFSTFPSATNIQLEKGSDATTYEPYENICPIEGWTEVEVYRTGKNLMKNNGRSYTNGDTTWIVNSDGSVHVVQNTSTANKWWSASSDGYWAMLKKDIAYTLQGGKPTAPIYLVGKDDDGTAWSEARIGGVDTGSNRTFTLQQNAVARYQIVAPKNSPIDTTVYPMLTVENATNYEPYNGTTIPVTFLSVINMLSSTTITTNKTLSSTGEEISESGMSLTNYIKVNEGDIYKLTFTSKEGARTRRIYGYNENKEPTESLASTSWVSVDTAGSIQATIPSGVEYIRICYKTADENIFLEGPESSVVYGGYVDLVNGEIVQEWEIASARWGDIKIGNPDDTTGYSYGYLPTIDSPKKITADSAYGVDIICNSIRKVLWEGTNKIPEHIYAPGPEYNRINVVGNFNDDLVIQIAFKLAEPIHYPINPQTLKTLRGTNNIWSNANGPIEISYWTH